MPTDTVRKLRQAGLSACLLLASAPVLASQCWQLHGQGVHRLPDCRVAGARLQLGSAGKSQLVQGPDGLARITAAGRFHYLHRNGRQLQVPAMDNGPDDFQHGLVRGVVNGRLGFYDRQLGQKIAAQFDGALPFDAATGTAWVCTGCRWSADGEDEHPRWVGGRHWQIDTAGKRVP